MSGKKNSEEGIFERDVELPLTTVPLETDSAKVNREEIKAKYTLAWMAEKLGGAKESLVEFATKLPTAPISWLTEEEKKHIHLGGQKEFLEGLTDFKPIYNYQQGKSTPVSTSMKVAGTVARGGASVGIFTIDSIAAVGMAVTKSARRAVGSVALFANMLRHGVHAVEDLFTKEKNTLQNLMKFDVDRFNLAFKKLGKEDQDKLNDITTQLLSAKSPKDIDNILTKENISLIKSINSPELEKQSVYLLSDAENWNKSSKGKREAHDEKFSQIPGVKEMRENINIAHDAASTVGHSVMQGLKHGLEGAAKAIGSSIKGKISHGEDTRNVDSQPTPGTSSSTKSLTRV